jgi:quercetin dioxygenase-like cupin family protein
LQAGADEVLERRYEPGQVVETHTHSFDAQALVTEGEMWLTFGDDTRHLRAGDRFHVPLGTPHSERYGPEGATYWVARRNAR